MTDNNFFLANLFSSQAYLQENLYTVQQSRQIQLMTYDSKIMEDHSRIQAFDLGGF